MTDSCKGSLPRYRARRTCSPSSVATPIEGSDGRSKWLALAPRFSVTKRCSQPRLVGQDAGLFDMTNSPIVSVTKLRRFVLDAPHWPASPALCRQHE
jgi:hypothetical protein